MALTERNQNTSRNAAQITPSSQSKLPRRVPTPNSAPTTIKWSSSVADRVASAEKTTNENRRSLAQKEAPISNHTRKVHEIHSQFLNFILIPRDSTDQRRYYRQASAGREAFAISSNSKTLQLSES